nr:BREX-1 system phosphatase PglZ type B [Rhodoferax sp.]
GWKVLERNDNGDGQGNAWCEFGDIDSEGHARGWKLAKHIDPLLAEIAERVAALLNVGWTSVRIVTDHGWLLMPGKLPKVEMAGDLTDNKWGRCASIKPGASTSERLYPWYWNPNQQFALADGVSCYRRSEEYTHGGLSLQECLTLELVVTKGSADSSKPVTEITDISWKGLRCTAAVDGQFTGLSMDIRGHAGDPTSSIVVSVKPLKENGTASVVIENEELQGNPAHIVLLNAAGELVAEANTVIGGG